MQIEVECFAKIEDTGCADKFDEIASLLNNILDQLNESAKHSQ